MKTLKDPAGGEDWTEEDIDALNKAVAAAIRNGDVNLMAQPLKDENFVLDAGRRQAAPQYAAVVLAQWEQEHGRLK